MGYATKFAVLFSFLSFHTLKREESVRGREKKNEREEKKNGERERERQKRERHLAWNY